MNTHRNLPVFIFIGVAVISCSVVSSREKQLARYSPAATLALPLSHSISNEYDDNSTQNESAAHEKKSDTLTKVQFEGKEYIIMNAVKDEDGEMIASDIIEPVYVVAKFKNVAERHGKVDLEFKIIVPEMLQYSRWQIRIYPRMEIDKDETGLDPVIITGEQYRKVQLKGYQHYERFLSTIISDSTLLLHRRQLETFIKRNIPQLYAFKSDTSSIYEDQFYSYFGVNEKEAVKHYTNFLKSKINRFRISRKQLMFKKMVKAPILTEGIRLDTVLRNNQGDFEYNYIQTINTRPKLRKVQISLSGEVFEQDRKVYVIPLSKPIVFYISSLATFVDERERYLQRIIERRVNVNTACYVEFEQNKNNVVESYGNNPEEIGRIKSNLRDILLNDEFCLDSIVIVASSSPEGAYSRNKVLSEQRSRAVTEYFKEYVKRQIDSMTTDRGTIINLDNEYSSNADYPDIIFISRSVPENWKMLDAIVRSDERLSPIEKDAYFNLSSIRNPDARESLLSKEGCYMYLRQSLYPRTRTVCFDFNLHRKGMVKDTVHTSEIDSGYMKGVQYICDREYDKALELLRPYNDFNTAVALCAMDYNNSALQVLNSLDLTPRVRYLKAIVLSRLGDESGAVESFIEACSEDHTLIHRGNLDPEISVLIKKYNINNLFNQL